MPMVEIPQTRPSLIARLDDASDAQAWEEFVAVYEPLVYRLARGRGFQDADAQEVVQEVLLAVSKAAGRWSPDPQRGRFRDWLFRIARNLMINFLTRRKHQPWGTGDSGIAQMLHQQCDPSCEQTAEFDWQYRREVFRWAAGIVREQVSDTTWQAFWKTSVEDTTPQQAARQLEMSVGSVYIARSRVMARLRDQAQRFVNAEASGETATNGRTSC